jgi:hypothetical protein
MQSLPALTQLTFELPSQRAVATTWAAPYKALRRGSVADYVDAVAVETVAGQTVAVEVMPAANESSMLGMTRTQAALKLYTAIYLNHPRPSTTLHVIA